jgi:hypothetical protein
MEKIKTYGSLFLVMVSCFTIGLYAASEFKYNEPIDLHRWIMTSIYGLAFLGYFLTNCKNKQYETNKMD